MSENSLIAKLNWIASKIEHEDNLIGQRTTWLVTSQSFLFLAFVAVVGEVGAEGAKHLPLAKLMLIVIPLTGLALPFLVLLAVAAASFELSQWRTERDRILQISEAKDLDWPSLDHPAVLKVFGGALPYATALAFLLAWIAILIQIWV